MARSPSDATRFTATGPYAAASTSFNSNAPRFGAGSQVELGSAPANETAQQKIARLRAAAATARKGKESQFDTAIRVGRTWADRAHRITAIGLIGLTVVSGTVAVAGISDMMIHNRRRRNEWLEEQQAKTARDTAEAKVAAASGMATEDQILLINRERAAEEAAEAKKSKPGVLKKTSNWLFSGLEKEEQKGGRLGAAAAGVEQAAEGVKDMMAGQQHDRSVLQAVQHKVGETRRQGERVAETINPLGGPLDRQAEQATAAIKGESKSWMSWLTGR